MCNNFVLRFFQLKLKFPKKFNFSSKIFTSSLSVNTFFSNCLVDDLTIDVVIMRETIDKKIIKFIIALCLKI